MIRRTLAVLGLAAATTAPCGFGQGLTISAYEAMRVGDPEKASMYVWGIVDTLRVARSIAPPSTIRPSAVCIPDAQGLNWRLLQITMDSRIAQARRSTLLDQARFGANDVAAFAVSALLDMHPCDK